MSKDMNFLSLARNLSNKYRKQSQDTASKKIIHKAGKFVGNKISDAVTKSSNTIKYLSY